MKRLDKVLPLTTFILGLILIFSSSYGKSLTEFLTLDVEEISLTTQILFLTGVALFAFGTFTILTKILVKPKEVKQRVIVKQVQHVKPKPEIVIDKPSKVEPVKSILEEKEWKEMEPFYVKVKGITFKVKGDKKDYRYWQASCEHTDFKELCLNCAGNILKEFNWDNIEVIKRT